MRTHIISLAAVALLVPVGAACSSGSARRGASASTTTQSRRPDATNQSAPDPRVSTSRARASRRPLTCAARAAPFVPHHQRDGTSRNLVPGQPIALLACRYHGFNQPQPIGTIARAVTNLPVSQIARDLNATPRPTSSVVPNCPIDFGETYILHFSYRDGRPLFVRFDNGGCRYVTNGDLTLPVPSARLTLRLEAALGQDHL